MEQYKLASEYREQSGKGAARKMRMDGMIPAILYGRDEDSVPIAVNELELRRILSSNWETAIVDLTVAARRCTGGCRCGALPGLAFLAGFFQGLFDAFHNGIPVNSCLSMNSLIYL